MADLAARIAAELENIDLVLRDLPPSEDVPSLSTLELAGAAALLHSFYNGVESILKQLLTERGVLLPEGASWHREILEACREHGLVARVRNVYVQLKADLGAVR